MNKINWNFDNTYFNLSKSFRESINPTPVKDPKIVLLNNNLAKSLKSRRLLLMTNVEGVLDNNKKLISEITSEKVIELIKNETISGGMIPKINTCLDAVKNGVTGVVIMDGRKPHSILNEIFSDTGAGTLIR